MSVTGGRGAYKGARGASREHETCNGPGGARPPRGVERSDCLGRRSMHGDQPGTDREGSFTGHTADDRPVLAGIQVREEDLEPQG